MTDGQAILERFRVDVDFYQAHFSELLEQYPEQWIAVYGEAVVGVAADPDALVASLRAKGVPPERALVTQLSRADETLILPA